METRIRQITTLLRIVVIDHDTSGAHYLKEEIESLDANYKVVRIISHPDEAIQYFHLQPAIDLIFMDIKLNDPGSFQIFDAVNISAPVIFTTAYNEARINELRANGIATILKPVTAEKLRSALLRFKSLQAHFLTHAMQPFVQQLLPVKAQKVIVKKGAEFRTLSVSEIVYFFVEQRIVFCVDQSNTKYISEWANLSDVYETLDTRVFFKANRKYIINVEYLKSFKTLPYGKTSIELAITPKEGIVVSQDNSVLFKTWIRNPGFFESNRTF